MNIEPNNDDVVSVTEQNMTPVRNLTFRVAQLRQVFWDNIKPFAPYDWFNQGVECEVLRPSGGGWKKGRLRLRLEFIPDEPEVIESSALVLPPSSDQ